MLYDVGDYHRWEKSAPTGYKEHLEFEPDVGGRTWEQIVHDEMIANKPEVLTLGKALSKVAAHSRDSV